MIRQIPIRGFDNNFSYIVGDGKSKHVAVVDPGDMPRLMEEIEIKELESKMVFLTHSHFDHQEGVADFVERFGIPVYMHKNAKGRVDVHDDMSIFLEEGDEIKVGDLVIKVIHTPGHIDDAICYYMEDEDGPALITGDTLFVEGCGRADLKGSDVKKLYESLERIKTLPDKTRIFSGHDYGSKPFSDIAWEKKHNRYMKCKTFKEFQELRMGR